MRSMWCKASGVAVGAVALSMLSMGTASAATWDGTINGPGGGADGKVSVSLRGSIGVDLLIIDTKSDGFCASVRLIADLPSYPDRDHDGPKACGHQKAVRWVDTISESGTIRGVKVQMCRVHSDGSDRHCETQTYVEAG